MYTVAWDSVAKQLLAAIWLKAPDRAAVSRSAPGPVSV